MNILSKKIFRALVVIVLNALLVLPMVLGFTHGDLSTRAPIEFIIVFPCYGLAMFVISTIVVMPLNARLDL